MIRALLLVVCILIAHELPAQNKFAPKIFTAKDGLPSTYLLRLNQDGKGNLWIGTIAGLSRFDGRSFSNFGIENGLTNISIDAIFDEGDSSRIWLGSRDGLFELKEDIAHRVETNDSIPVVFVFGIQRMRNQEIWAMTGLGIYRLTKNQANRIRLPGLEREVPRQLIETDRGMYVNLIRKRSSPIFLIDRDGKPRVVSLGIPEARSVNILRVTDKGLVINTESNVYAISEGKSKELFASQLSGKSLTGCMYDSKGRLWVSTDEDGILVADPGEEDKFAHQVLTGSPDNIISSFFEDRDGRMWAAAANGLLKISSIDYKVYGKENHVLEKMQEIMSDRDGNIFVSGESGLFKLKQDIFTPVVVEGKESLQNNLRGVCIDSWCFDDANNMWFMTREGKFCEVTSGHVIERGDRKYVVGYEHVKIRYDDFRKKVWLPSDGLLLGDEHGTIPFKPVNNIIISDPMLILPFSNGNVLVKTEINEFFLIDSGNTAYRIKPAGDLDPKRIVSFYKDGLENLWIFYLDGGLRKCHIENNELLISDMVINAGSGLSSNIIGSVVFDRQNRIWATTHRGLAVVDWLNAGSNGAPFVCQADIEFNLPIKNWESSELMLDRAGNIWVTTAHEVVKIFADEIRPGSVAPTVSIENVELNSGTNNQMDSVINYSRFIAAPVFSYDENSITISFKDVSLIDGDVQYSYRLKGLSDKWIEGDQSRLISYIKLTPGDYEFMVKARRSGTTWSSPATFAFSILNPFWKKWWFISSGVFAFLLLAYSLHIYRVRQAVKIERLRLRIAQDLHDDIGSTLSSISFYVESIRKQTNGFDPQTSGILDQIGKTSGHVISALGDIVWAINPAKDDVSSLISRMNAYATALCAAKNIQLEFREVDEIRKSKLKVEVRKNLYLIFKEAVNNSVKHSGCSKIQIHLSAVKHGLEMIITDNGKGFLPNFDHDGNGLRNMMQRCAEIEYKFDISSDAGRGSIIAIRLV